MPYLELKQILVILDQLLHRIREQVMTQQLALAMTNLSTARKLNTKFYERTENTYFKNLFHELDILIQLDSVITGLNTEVIDLPLLDSKLNYLLACRQFLDFFLYVSLLHELYLNEIKITRALSTGEYLQKSTCRWTFFKKIMLPNTADFHFHSTFNLTDITNQLVLMTPEDKQRLCMSAFAEADHEPDPKELMTIFAQSTNDNLWIGADIARLVQTIKNYRYATKIEPPTHAASNRMY